jgi:hypothetical protein
VFDIAHLKIDFSLKLQFKSTSNILALYSTLQGVFSWYLKAKKKHPKKFLATKNKRIQKKRKRMKNPKANHWLEKFG